MKLRKKWIVAAPLLVGVGYLALVPQAAYAFLGGMVWDPGNYGAIVKVWHSDLTNGVKIAKTYNEAVKITKSLFQTYQLAMAMSQRIQNKDVWKMATFSVGNEITTTHYNESVNFGAVMNGDALNAGHAWHESTLDAGYGGYLGSAKAQDSRRMAEFATIQLLDQTSRRCAAILASYKSTQELNQPAEEALKGDTFDRSDAKNAVVSALNVLAGGRVHLQTQERANGNLQACLAEQQTLEAKVQRDRLADEQRWYADVAQERAKGPALLDPDKTASSTGHYLLP